MYLSSIILEQFRCYERQDLQLPAEGIRLAGANASGKTSFVEGIRILSMMKSARASAERELINWTSNQEFGLPPYARIRGRVHHQSGTETDIEISLTADPNRPSHTRKQIKIDGQPKRAIDAVGYLKTVLFEPEDMDLVLGAPSVRRRYLDVAISSLDRTYLRLLSQYGKVLEQRNGLLKALRELPGTERRNRLSELDYWNDELLNRAAYIVSARHQYLESTAVALDEAFRALLGDEYQLTARYSESWTGGGVDDDRPEHLGIQDERNEYYDLQSIVLTRLRGELERRRDEELARGVTAFGPHRDDIQLFLDGRPLDAFGSRGQQRLAVVALKLSEVEAVRSATGSPAVLLLDDVLSELDELRQSRLLERVSALGGQVIVTATDSALIDVDPLAHLPLYSVENGVLTRISAEDA
jgi:DNA replication and repair protein RecF